MVLYIYANPVIDVFYQPSRLTKGKGKYDLRCTKSPFTCITPDLLRYPPPLVVFYSSNSFDPWSTTSRIVACDLSVE